MNAESRGGESLRSVQTLPQLIGPTAPAAAAGANRVLRDTYRLLSATLFFSAAVAAASVALKLPHPGIIATLIGFFALLYATAKLRNSGWGLAAVFGLTGFMGYTLGPIVSHYLALPNGHQVVMMAMGGTAAIFVGLSAYATASGRDFSLMGGFLLAGAIVAFMAGLGAIFLQIPALALAVSAVFVLLSGGLILFETSRIIHGGETNYITATVSLYVSIYNLFSSLLALIGFGTSSD